VGGDIGFRVWPIPEGSFQLPQVAISPAGTAFASRWCAREAGCSNAERICRQNAETLTQNHKIDKKALACNFFLSAGVRQIGSR
jgi:hypothetical protein